MAIHDEMVTVYVICKNKYIREISVKVHITKCNKLIKLENVDGHKIYESISQEEINVIIVSVWLCTL